MADMPEVVAAIETRHDEAMEVYKATRDQYHSGYADGLEAALREFEREDKTND